MSEKQNLITSQFGAIKINRKELEKQLAIAVKCTDSKGPMSILANVELHFSPKKGMTIRATTLDQCFEGSVGCDVQNQGAVSVNAKELLAAVKAHTFAEIEICGEVSTWQVVDKDKTTDHSSATFQIKTALVTRTLSAVLANQLPTLDLAGIGYSSLDADAFGDMIDKVIFSASNDTTRVHLAGVFIKRDNAAQRILMATTDGHRLTTVTRPDSVCLLETTAFQQQGIIVPKKGLALVQGLIKKYKGIFEVGCRGSFFFFRCALYTLAIRLIDAQFPDYKQVIPTKHTRQAIVLRSQFTEALRAVADVKATDMLLGNVSLDFTENACKIASYGTETEATTGVACEFKGTPFKIGFKSKYLHDFLEATSSPEVLLQFSDDCSPVLMTPLDDQDYQGVVMPVRM